MRIIIRAGLVVFGLLSIIAFSISLSFVKSLYLRDIDRKEPPPVRHFALYLPSINDSFFRELAQGALRAAEESGNVFSIHSIDPNKHELEMAAYTGVDGVIVCPYLDDDQARKQLLKLSEKRIPVILINHNVPHTQPWPYVGTNNYDVGRKMGTLASRLRGRSIRAAVVYSGKAPGIFAERELIEIGIMSTLGDRAAAPIKGLRTDENPLDAEALVYRLARTDPRIDTLIFTDALDTVAAAQALIDLNLVGRVSIIGFGGDDAIREYIRKGIIAGSVVVDPGRIGEAAVKSLVELASSGYTSNSVDTGVEIIGGAAR